MPSLGDRYLVRKRNVYWFKRDIPEALRPQFGKTAYSQNLKTSDVRVAKRRRDQVAAEVDAMFRDARDGAKDDAHAAARREVEFLISHDRTRFEGEDAGDGPVDAAERFLDRHDRTHGTRFRDMAYGRKAVDDPLEDHLREVDLALKTKAERRAIVKEFAEWAATRSVSLPSLPRRRAAEYFEAKVLPLHRLTAAKRLSNLRRYWEWLLERGHAEGDNPWAALKMPAERKGRAARKEDAERPFTDVEMATLFSATPAGSPESVQRLRDAMAFGALTGMRIDEICRLTVADCTGGVFRIREGKTDSAARTVPTHSGLAGIVARRVAGKPAGERLFSDVDGQGAAISDPLSKQFGRFIRAAKVADLREGHRRSKVNFHSFRRWFVTKAEQAGQPPHVISAVVGHAEGRQGMTLSVYSAGPSSDQMRACVEAVKLPSPSAQYSLAGPAAS